MEVPPTAHAWGFIPMQVVSMQLMQSLGPPVHPPAVFRSGPAGLADGQQVRHILCYGDSMTVGFCCGGTVFEPYAQNMACQLGRAGICCEITACGISGCRADDMAEGADGVLVDTLGLGWKGLQRCLREDGPFDLVLIMAGTNDLGGAPRPGISMGGVGSDAEGGFGRTPTSSTTSCCQQQEALVRSLRLLHQACHELGVPTVALAPPPIPQRGGPRAVMWEVLRQPVTEALRLMAAEMPGMVAAIDPASLVSSFWTECWDPDNLHFSALGSSALGQGLADLAASRFLHCAPPSPPSEEQQKQMEVWMQEELEMATVVAAAAPEAEVEVAGAFELGAWQQVGQPSSFATLPLYAWVLVQM